MNTVQTAIDRDFNALPIVCPDFSNVVKLDVSTVTSTESEALSAGAYIITPAIDIFLTISESPTASAAAGSLFYQAGSQVHLVIREGMKISVIAKEEIDGSVYIAPLL